MITKQALSLMIIYRPFRSLFRFHSTKQSYLSPLPFKNTIKYGFCQSPNHEQIPFLNMQITHQERDAGDGDIFDTFHTFGAVSTLLRDPQQEDRNFWDLCVFTYSCPTCNQKALRSFTKKAFDEGAVLILCSNCRKGHQIANAFSDQPVTSIENMGEIRQVQGYARYVSPYFDIKVQEEKQEKQNEEEKVEQKEEAQDDKKADKERFQKERISEESQEIPQENQKKTIQSQKKRMQREMERQFDLRMQRQVEKMEKERLAQQKEIAQKEKLKEKYSYSQEDKKRSDVWYEFIKGKDPEILHYMVRGRKKKEKKG